MKRNTTTLHLPKKRNDATSFAFFAMPPTTNSTQRSVVVIERRFGRDKRRIVMTKVRSA